LIDHILSKNEKVLAYLEKKHYSRATEQLLKIQLDNWKELAEEYKRLSSVKIKIFLFEDFQIKLQFNPGRLKSTSAEVSDVAIKKRSCFLCADNLPSRQKGIKLLDKYILLCNPYPVFPHHFTIAAINHHQQEIKSSFSELLLLAKMLSKKYSLIYNGPKCGASAPDHLHFQACTKHQMSIENDFHFIVKRYGEKIINNEQLYIAAINDGLRRFISFETKDKNILQNTFAQFYKAYREFKSEEGEPMMNIICNYEKEFGWRVIIFLRSKHRPSHYFLDNDKKYIISPAAIDLGGLCIIPIEKDFIRIDKETLGDIFKEVSLQNGEYEKLLKALKEKYS
jgi:ATP adenylyltransferase/5',5'''-P-1,P-4-tetraphosphate phosphorylase II